MNVIVRIIPIFVYDREERKITNTICYENIKELSNDNKVDFIVNDMESKISI